MNNLYMFKNNHKPPQTSPALRNWHTLAAVLLFACITSPASAQNRFEWTTYSALINAQGVTVDAGQCAWVATTGGLIRFDRTATTYDVFRTTEGLLSLDVRCIAQDPATGDMYAGGTDGTVSIYRKTGQWKYTMDIAQATEYANRGVNGFGFRNGRVYILCDFGVAVFSSADSTLTDAYVRLGTLPLGTPVYDIKFFGSKIWLATGRGVVCAPENASNLASPDAWNVYGVGKGVANEQTLSLAVIDSTLNVGTMGGAFVLGSTDRFSSRPDLPVSPVRFSVRGARIVASAGYDLYGYASGTGFTKAATAADEMTGLAIDSDGTVYAALKNKGVGIMRGTAFGVQELNSPVSNIFGGLVIATDSSVWAASTRNLNGAGLSRLKQGQWARFSVDNTPALKSNNVWHIGAGPEGTVWAGTRGRGFVRFVPGSSSVTSAQYTNTNSPLTGISVDPDYVLGGASVTDINGRVWMINFDNTSANGPLLLAWLRKGETSADGSGFEAFPSALTNLIRAYRWLAIDQNNTKWLGSDEAQFYPGLVYMSDNGTFKDRSDDQWGKITTDDGLLTNQQTALAVDADGELWIGSPRGVQVLVNPASVAIDGQKPVFRLIRSLKDVPVYTIAVDALNRKWVGTDQGVYVLSTDGTAVLYRFTKATSPLVNDQVRSIVTADATGDVYIGTMNGLCRVSTDAVRSVEVSAILCTPNPFVIPSADPLRIQGIPAGGSIKILSTSGAVVRRFQAPGGAIAFWDGTDQSGNPVPAGVYIVAAGNPDLGGTIILGKVAVVRQ